MPDLTLSLAQLTGEVPPHPGKDASYLVRRCGELYQKPLDRFEIEDLRIMLGQKLGVTHLLPLALAALEQDALSMGDMYEGDLLVVVLRLDWTSQRGDLVARIAEIVDRVASDDPMVTAAIAAFRGGKAVDRS